MTEHTLEPQETKLIEQESAVLKRVQEALALTPLSGGTRADFDAEMLSLRDQIAESRAEDHAMLVEHMTRLSALRSAQTRRTEAAVDPANPYFARLELTDKHEGKLRHREVLIGRRGFIDTKRNVQIVDWRNSPISRIYYCYEGGDEYEERFADVLHVGRVSTRRTVHVTEGRLNRIIDGEAVFICAANGVWQRVNQESHRLSGGSGVAIRPPAERLGRGPGDHSLPEITALIDPAQFRAITEDYQGIVVLRGGAGTGKTTIALHRVAWLFFQDRRRFNPKQILVITPGPGLSRYVSRVLPALDVRGVSIQTYAKWAFNLVKRLIPSLRRRKSIEEAPPGARRLKRHPALLKILEEAVSMEARTLDEAFGIEGGPALLDAWVRRRTLAPMQRLEALQRWLERDGRSLLIEKGISIRKLMSRAKDELNDPAETWANVLTDKTLLAAGLQKEGVSFESWELDQLVDIVAKQSEDPADYAGLGEHRTGIDGRSISEGELAGCLDTDDCSILLRICQLKYGRMTGPSGHKVRYEHIVADEAQDLSPISIKVLCEAARPGAPVTLAGDTAQRLSLDSGFADWERMVKTAKIKARILPPLAISYRSTRQVMRLARHVLGPLAPSEAGHDVRDGAPVELFTFSETGEAVGFLGDALKNLQSRERRANVALVSKTPEVADLYYHALKRAQVDDLRRIRHQEFDFSSGIDVTDIYQIKGLEYDYVVILEPSVWHYPDNLEARHLLHVACTRAAYQLWLVLSEPASPLLPGPEFFAPRAQLDRDTSQ